MVKGADISKWQDDNTTARRPDFAKLKAAGCEFVFIRAAFGLSADEDFAYNWQAAKDAGLLRGAYQWLVWGVDAAAQAQRLYALIASDPGELPPVVDYEDRSNMPPAGTMRLALRNYLIQLEMLTRRKAIIYTGPDYWKNYGSTDMFWKSYPLWIANYNTTAPVVPAPWDDWTFWQWTAKGDGLAHGMESLNIDLDWYRGSLAELFAFAGVDTTPPPPPVEPPPAPATGWYMPIPVPGNGIPAITQTSQVRDMSKRAAMLLDAGWQDWLKRLQPSADVYGWYIKPDACPTKGINGNGKLIHNRIVYAGNPIKITEIVDGWGQMGGFQPVAPPLAVNDYWRYDRPDIVARLWQVETSGKLNVPSRLASLARLPIFAGWVEMSRVTRIQFPRTVTVKAALNIRATPDKSQKPIGNLSVGAPVRISDITPGQGGWWGKLADRAGYICLRWSDASNPRGTNYTDWLI